MRHQDDSMCARLAPPRTEIEGRRIRAIHTRQLNGACLLLAQLRHKRRCIHAVGGGGGVVVVCVGDGPRAPLQHVESTNTGHESGKQSVQPLYTCHMATIIAMSRAGSMHMQYSRTGQMERAMSEMAVWTHQCRIRSGLSSSSRGQCHGGCQRHSRRECPQRFLSCRDARQLCSTTQTGTLAAQVGSNLQS